MKQKWTNDDLRFRKPRIGFCSFRKGNFEAIKSFTLAPKGSDMRNPATRAIIGIPVATAALFVWGMLFWAVLYEPI